MKEETLTQKVVRVYGEQNDAHDPGLIANFFDLAIMKLASLATLLVGLGIVPYHMVKNAGTGNSMPSVPLIVLSVIMVVLGTAGINPKATQLASSTARQFLPARWNGKNGA